MSKKCPIKYWGSRAYHKIMMSKKCPIKYWGSRAYHKIKMSKKMPHQPVVNRFHSVWPHSDKWRSLEPCPLSRCPSSRYPFGRCPLSRIPFSRISLNVVYFCDRYICACSTTLISVFYLYHNYSHRDHLAWTYTTAVTPQAQTFRISGHHLILLWNFVLYVIFRFK